MSILCVNSLFFNYSLINSSLFFSDGTLLTGPQAVVTNTVGPGDVLNVSWPTPSNTNFLIAYSVSYSTSSRSRRQASSVEVPADTTSTTLPFRAFTDYTVDVDAIYAPPPDGNRVAVNLLPPTTFTTPERRKKINYSNSGLIYLRGEGWPGVA